MIDEGAGASVLSHGEAQRTVRTPTLIALRRRAIVCVCAAMVSAALLAPGIAQADTVATNFEAPQFHTGSVNGQEGWKSAVPGDIPSLPHGYDQAVVANSGAPPEFGGQSLRLSNAYNQSPLAGPPEFHFQTYSKPTTEAAGEGLANTEYTAQFSFISVKPDAQQPGLKVSISPDEGEGGRMSYIGLEDVPSGIEVTFYDTDVEGEFVGYDLGILPRAVPHTIKFWMRLDPGPNNDLVRIAIDGRDVGQCFTTWENFYRSQSQPVPTTDTLQFRSVGEQETPSLVGGGYLFDNVTITTSKGAGPPRCEMPIEKHADVRAVSAGGLVGYRITVRNRGRLPALNYQVCDRIPRDMTFVGASRRLQALGARRCVVISHLAPGKRFSFHVVLRVDAGAPPGSADNVAEDAPVQPPGLPLPPPPTNALPGAVGVASEVQKASAVVTVRPKRPPAAPRFTG
jgi:uncharacterized repeat protein (TIGR01451 family)